MKEHKEKEKRNLTLKYFLYIKQFTYINSHKILEVIISTLIV